MTSTGWALLLAALTLAVTVPTLYLAVRQELRARDRGDVEWQVQSIEEGVFAVANVGSDVARRITVQAWTRHEIETVTRKVLAPDDFIQIVLPLRREQGPDPATTPTPYPRPQGFPVPPQIAEVFDRMARDEQAAQVSVKVTWRTRWGTWQTYTDRTG